MFCACTCIIDDIRNIEVVEGSTHTFIISSFERFLSLAA